ncbi:PilN domain-containing protein [Terriglobus aquaticus]|uniref:PilN domain-containing protein n=1 Tax=Terriglobus aquaticus TaxID=940139 RepID=A0ABW9KH79_9BACT|nr:PilN domain-containing protein [Terriglobus aquaticus]
MRITINLATRPYVQLDRVFRQLRVAIAVLALTAAALLLWLHGRSAAARAQQAELESIQARTAALNAERARNEARLRQPANAAVLQQIDFLNALYTRKSFSWTAVLMDLEEVLPSGLQVTSIDPQIASNGQVNIRMRVSGPRERSVQLIRNLEGSHRFLAPRLVGETQQAQEKSGSGVQMAAAYLNGPQAANSNPTALVNSNSGTANAGPPPTDFDIVAGYNPLQLRVRERAAHHTAAQDTDEDAATSSDDTSSAAVPATQTRKAARP